MDNDVAKGEVLLITTESSSPVNEFIKKILSQEIFCTIFNCIPGVKRLSLNGTQGFGAVQLMVIEDNYLQDPAIYEDLIFALMVRRSKAMVVFITKDPGILISTGIRHFKETLEYQGAEIFGQVKEPYDFIWFIRKNGDESYLKDLEELIGLMVK